jgi:integrase/recombinase XerD
MGITSLDVDPTRTTREFASGDLVKWFLDYYWIRHPISQEALDAYRLELLALDQWLGASRGKRLVTAGHADLRDYFGTRYHAAKLRATDLPSLACVRRFYFYLVEVGLRADDPTEHLYVRSQPVARGSLAVVPRGRA